MAEAISVAGSETVNLNASGGFKVTIKSKSGETSPADDISRAASEEGHGASDGGDLQSSVITKPLSPIVSPARHKAADGEGSEGALCAVGHEPPGSSPAATPAHPHACAGEVALAEQGAHAQGEGEAEPAVGLSTSHVSVEGGGDGGGSKTEGWDAREMDGESSRAETTEEGPDKQQLDSLEGDSQRDGWNAGVIAKLMQELVSQVEVVSRVVAAQEEEAAEVKRVEEREHEAAAAAQAAMEAAEAEETSEALEALAGLLAETDVATPRQGLAALLPEVPVQQIVHLPLAPTPSEDASEVRARLQAEADAALMADLVEILCGGSEGGGGLIGRVEEEEAVSAAVLAACESWVHEVAGELAEGLVGHIWQEAEAYACDEAMAAICDEVLGMQIDAVAEQEMAAACAAAVVEQEGLLECVHSVVNEELCAAVMAEDIVSDLVRDELTDQVTWCRHRLEFELELEAEQALVAARREAVVRLGKAELAGLHANVSEAEQETGLVTRTQTAPPPNAMPSSLLPPSAQGSLMDGLEAKAREYQVEETLEALEATRVSTAAAVGVVTQALELKRRRLAALKSHLHAIKEHLSTIDPKLVKAATTAAGAASKQGLSSLLRESKRLLERKGFTDREIKEVSLLRRERQEAETSYDEFHTNIIAASPRTHTLLLPDRPPATTPKSVAHSPRRESESPQRRSVRQQEGGAGGQGHAVIMDKAGGQRPTMQGPRMHAHASPHTNLAISPDKPSPRKHAVAVSPARPGPTHSLWYTDAHSRGAGDRDAAVTDGGDLPALAQSTKGGGDGVSMVVGGLVGSSTEGAQESEPLPPTIGGSAGGAGVGQGTEANDIVFDRPQPWKVLDVGGNVVNVRAAASVVAEKVGEVRCGEVLEALGRRGPWLRIALTGGLQPDSPGGERASDAWVLHTHSEFGVRICEPLLLTDDLAPPRLGDSRDARAMVPLAQAGVRGGLDTIQSQQAWHEASSDPAPPTPKQTWREAGAGGSGIGAELELSAIHGGDSDGEVSAFGLHVQIDGNHNALSQSSNAGSRREGAKGWGRPGRNKWRQGNEQWELEQEAAARRAAKAEISYQKQRSIALTDALRRQQRDHHRSLAADRSSQPEPMHPRNASRDHGGSSRGNGSVRQEESRLSPPAWMRHGAQENWESPPLDGMGNGRAPEGGGWAGGGRLEVDYASPRDAGLARLEQDLVMLREQEARMKRLRQEQRQRMKRKELAELARLEKVRLELELREKQAREQMQVRMLERQAAAREKKEAVERRARDRQAILLAGKEHEKQFVERLREIKAVADDTGDGQVYLYKQMERRARSMEESRQQARDEALEQRRKAMKKPLPRSSEPVKPSRPADAALQPDRGPRVPPSLVTPAAASSAAGKPLRLPPVPIAGAGGGAREPGAGQGAGLGREGRIEVSPVARQGVVLAPVVPPARKLLAEQRENLERKLVAKREYADRVRRMKLKPKAQAAAPSGIEVFVRQVVKEANLGAEYVDVFLKGFKIKRLEDFGKLDEAALSAEHLRPAEKKRLAAVLVAHGVAPLRSQPILPQDDDPRAGRGFKAREAQGDARGKGARVQVPRLGIEEVDVPMQATRHRGGRAGRGQGEVSVAGDDLHGPAAPVDHHDAHARMGVKPQSPLYRELAEVDGGGARGAGPADVRPRPAEKTAGAPFVTSPGGTRETSGREAPVQGPLERAFKAAAGVEVHRGADISEAAGETRSRSSCATTPKGGQHVSQAASMPARSRGAGGSATGPVHGAGAANATAGVAAPADAPSSDGRVDGVATPRSQALSDEVLRPDLVGGSVGGSAGSNASDARNGSAGSNASDARNDAAVTGGSDGGSTGVARNDSPRSGAGHSSDAEPGAVRPGEGAVSRAGTEGPGPVTPAEGQYDSTGPRGTLDAAAALPVDGAEESGLEEYDEDFDHVDDAETEELGLGSGGPRTQRSEVSGDGGEASDSQGGDVTGGPRTQRSQTAAVAAAGPDSGPQDDEADDRLERVVDQLLAALPEEANVERQQARSVLQAAGGDPAKAMEMLGRMSGVSGSHPSTAHHADAEATPRSKMSGGGDGNDLSGGSARQSAPSPSAEETGFLEAGELSGQDWAEGVEPDVELREDDQWEWEVQGADGAETNRSALLQSAPESDKESEASVDGADFEW